MRIFGLAGWSGSGKTTLMAALIPHFVLHGVSVSTVKHAHHSFDIDQPGKDSWRHRQAGAQEVMQYRGQIMPLIRLSKVIAGAPEAGATRAEARLQVVVYSEAGRSVGLVVDRIVDIVEEKLVVQTPAQRHGVLGSSVVQKRVTDLLDVPGVVRNVIPSFAESPASH